VRALRRNRRSDVPERYDPLRLGVDALAVYRLTKLATADILTQPVRDRVIATAYATAGRAEDVKDEIEHEGDWQNVVVAEDPTPPKLAYLFTCRWCAGMWISFAVLAVRRTRWWPHVADALAYSSAAALLARFED
jgi:hypothetical protein